MKKKRNKKISPVQLIAAGFFVLILIGGGLLSLPMFSQNGTNQFFGCVVYGYFGNLRHRIDHTKYSRALEQCRPVFDHDAD